MSTAELTETKKLGNRTLTDAYVAAVAAFHKCQSRSDAKNASVCDWLIVQALRQQRYSADDAEAGLAAVKPLVTDWFATRRKDLQFVPPTNPPESLLVDHFEDRQPTPQPAPELAAAAAPVAPPPPPVAAPVVPPVEQTAAQTLTTDPVVPAGDQADDDDKDSKKNNKKGKKIETGKPAEDPKPILSEDGSQK